MHINQFTLWSQSVKCLRVMLFIEEGSQMSKSGYSDIELLEYINKHFDEIECEFNGEEYKEPKCNHNLCIDCNVVKMIDYERSALVCTKCFLCEYYPVYVASYNHTMQPLRRKCIYKDLIILRLY